MSMKNDPNVIKNVKVVAAVEIPEGIPLSKEFDIEVPKDGSWESDRYALRVGTIYHRESGDEVKSAFKTDVDNDNTELFTLAKNSGILATHDCLIFDKEGCDTVATTQYYVPYDVEEHRKHLPTVTDEYVAGCMNVAYKFTYEVLLVAGESWMRYLYFDIATSGPYNVSLLDEISDLENVFEEFFEDGTHGFSHEDQEYTVEFYDFRGDKQALDVGGIRELLSMIHSIRMVSLESRILTKEEMED